MMRVVGASSAPDAGLVPEESIDELIASGREAWLHIRTTKIFRGVIKTVVDDLLTANGTRTIAELLDDAGISEKFATQVVTDVLKPFIERAVEDGHIEARIRARLEAFYASYQTTT